MIFKDPPGSAFLIHLFILCLLFNIVGVPGTPWLFQNRLHDLEVNLPCKQITELTMYSGLFQTGVGQQGLARASGKHLFVSKEFLSRVIKES